MALNPTTRGRLVSLSHYTKAAEAILVGSTPASNIVLIEFPSMPSHIDLVRSAQYDVASVFTTPDGFHMFQKTNPLEIPFSFKLHHNDDFCERGSLTLLEIAAKLHALTLPIGDSSRSIATQVSPAPEPGVTGTENQPSQSARDAFNKSYAFDASENSRVYLPVACKLDLIYAGSNAPGISCVGYVKDVKARLLEPFMLGPNGEYNLPTAAEYEFTFVHRPSHTNAQPRPGDTYAVANKQAYADDVKSRLYNTVHLLKNSNVSYQGFNT